MGIIMKFIGNSKKNNAQKGSIIYSSLSSAQVLEADQALDAGVYKHRTGMEWTGILD